MVANGGIGPNLALRFEQSRQPRLKGRYGELGCKPGHLLGALRAHISPVNSPDSILPARRPQGVGPG